jgi:hypothetical protein
VVGATISKAFWFLLYWTVVLSLVSGLVLLICIPVYSSMYSAMVPPITGVSFPIYFVSRDASALRSERIARLTPEPPTDDSDDIATDSSSSKSSSSPSSSSSWFASSERPQNQVDVLLEQALDMLKSSQEQIRQYQPHQHHHYYLPPSTSQFAGSDQLALLAHHTSTAAIDSKHHQPTALVEVTTDIMASSSVYSFRLEMVVPESPSNYACSMSAVTLTLFDASGALIAEFARSVCLNRFRGNGTPCSTAYAHGRVALLIVCANYANAVDFGVS